MTGADHSDGETPTPEQIVEDSEASGKVIRCEPPDGPLKRFVHVGIDLDNPWARLDAGEEEARLCTPSEVARHVENDMPAVYQVPFERSVWGDA